MAGERSAGAAGIVGANDRRRRDFLTGTALSLGLLPILVNADDEALEEDFLEYLAEFDDEDDDWSWFDSADNKSVKQPPGKPTGTKPTVAEKPKP